MTERRAGATGTIAARRLGLVAAGAAILVAAGPARAQDAPVVAGAGGAPAVIMDAAACRSIGAGVEYRQPPGVAYQPGVSARGDPVVPADLYGGHAVRLPEEIAIPVTVDLAGPWRDPDDPVGVVNTEALLGVVTIRDGDAFWNGEPVEPATDRALREGCRRLDAMTKAAGGRKPAPPAQ